jgi:molybdopterin-synthase adenylyltransferase
MTAVGADLAYVGRLAAKAAVATVLERDGYRDQRIDGNHAAIGLRPGRRYTPPFDDLHHGDTRWTRFDRRPDCHVCATTP